MSLTRSVEAAGRDPSRSRRADYAVIDRASVRGVYPNLTIGSESRLLRAAFSLSMSLYRAEEVGLPAPLGVAT